VYEQLMTYWHETMHDDVYLLIADGWQQAATPRLTINDKERRLTEEPDLTVGRGRSAQKYKMDLIPPALIVDRYFPDQQAHVDELTAAAEEASLQVEEYIEEHTGEDGLLSGAMDDDRITKALVSARIKEIKSVGDSDEVGALKHLVKLYNAEASAKKAARDARADLDQTTLNKYGDLTENDIKTLVPDDKWHATVVQRISDEVETLTLDLVARIQQLGERYSKTVSDIEAELVDLES